VSGALSVLAAAAAPSIYSVTVAEVAVGIFGYNPGGSPTGAISPSAFKSATITNVASRTPTAGSENDISIVLGGALAQSYFSALIVQRTDGTVRRYATADATFSVFGGDTLSQWTWDDDDPAWTSAGTRFLLLYP
jgi:hypothetical protein